MFSRSPQADSLTINRASHRTVETVVFSSDRNGGKEIWRVNIDGTGLRQLTTGGGLAPDVTPDGARIVYVLNRGGKDTLWSIPFTGGESVQLNQRRDPGSKVSPDGTLVACGYKADKGSPLRLAILNIRDGSPVKNVRHASDDQF
jgi:TolB protein